MSYAFVLDAVHRFGIVRFSGRVVGADLLAAQRGLFDAGRAPGTNTVWDTRPIEHIDLSPSDVTAYLELLRAYEHRLGPDERVAVIVSRALEQTLAAMFVGVSRTVIRREHQLVRTLEAAAEWTGLDPALLEPDENAWRS
jgi:cob(I)alamin adenosyltransferase